MSRYIDADKLDYTVTMVGRDEYAGYRAVAFKSDIDYMPTADVVEVRHGEWKQASEKYPRYVCTSCNHLFNNKNYNYCPNCGAKMDGKRKEDGGK